MAAPAWPLTYSHLWFLTINNRQIFAMILLSTVWKRSKYGVFSGRYFLVFSPNMGEYGPGETPYLDTFHSVQLLSEMQNDFSGKRPITGKSLSSFELIISKVFWLHYVKSVQIRSFSGPYFPVFGLNTKIFYTFHAVLGHLRKLIEKFLVAAYFFSKCEKIYS